MKQRFLLLVLMALPILASAQNAAGNDGAFKHAVKTKPIQLLQGNFQASYEQAFSKRSSFEVTFGFVSNGDSSMYRPHNAIQLGAGYRFFLYSRNENRRQLANDGYLAQGFYLSPRLNYTRIWDTYACYVGNNGWMINYEDRTFHQNNVQVALTFGYQWMWKSGFLIDAFITPVAYGPNNGHFSDYAIRLRHKANWGFKLGWAF